MSNIIEFPLGGGSGDEPPPSVDLSGLNSDQIARVCLVQLFQVQASLTALSVVFANELALLSDSVGGEVIDPGHVIESYEKARRSTLSELFRELQERFPPR